MLAQQAAVKWRHWAGCASRIAYKPQGISHPFWLWKLKGDNPVLPWSQQSREAGRTAAFKSKPKQIVSLAAFVGRRWSFWFAIYDGSVTCNRGREDLAAFQRYLSNLFRDDRLIPPARSIILETKLAAEKDPAIQRICSFEFVGGGGAFWLSFSLFLNSFYVLFIFIFLFLSDDGPVFTQADWNFNILGRGEKHFLQKKERKIAFWLVGGSKAGYLDMDIGYNRCGLNRPGVSQNHRRFQEINLKKQNQTQILVFFEKDGKIGNNMEIHPKKTRLFLKHDPVFQRASWT